jgi:competence protein ComEC
MQKLETAPALKTVILLAIGIFIGKYPVLPYYVPMIITCLLIASYILLKEKTEFTKLALISVIIISAGIYKGHNDFNNEEKNSASYLKKNVTEVYLTGVINNLPEYSKNRVRYTVDAEAIVSRRDTLKISGKILVILKQTKETGEKDTLPSLEAGDRVLMFGDLKDAPDETNPGDFNYRNYLALNDILKIFKVNFYSDVEIISRNNLNYFEQNIVYPARKYAIQNIAENVGGDEGAFLNGLVTGYRADFSKELKDDFVKAGVMHLIAVSGLNVAYIIIFLTITFSLLRIPLSMKIYLILAALIFYCYFTGATASIVRAVIMGSLMILNYKVQRKINFLNVIGFSALIILLIDARQLFDAGFILSYSAVLSIVIIFERINDATGRKMEDWVKDWRKIFYYGYITLLTSVSAQAGVLPITIRYFEKVSLAGVFTNIIAIPLSNFSLALGFIQILAGIVSDYLSSVVAEVNYVLLHFQLMFIKWAAGLDYSYFEVFGMSAGLLILYYTVLGLLIWGNKKNLMFRLSASVILVLMYLVFTSYDTKEMQVTYLSLGNADCTHIETPDGSNILIDVGVENQFNNSTTLRIVPYLKRKNVKEIDLLIITAETGKNYKALLNILQNFDVKRIIMKDVNDIKNTTDKIVVEKKITVENISEMKEISGFGNVKLYFLNSDTSNSAVKLEYGKNNFLFTGKAEEDDELELLKIYGEGLKSDILKVARYGSDKSTSMEFVMKVKPLISVISTASIKERDLPSKYVIRRLELSNSRVYRTDEEGAVIIRSDGERLFVDS